MAGLRPFVLKRYQQAAHRRFLKLVGKGKEIPPMVVNLAQGEFKSESLPSSAEIIEGLSDYPFYYVDEPDRRHLRIIQSNDSVPLVVPIIEFAKLYGVQCVAVNGVNRQKVFSLNHANQVYESATALTFVLSTYEDPTETFTVSLEQWQKDHSDSYKGRINNRWVSKLWAQGDSDHFQITEATDLKVALPGPTTEDLEFDVDYVFTWVNSDDPGWKKLYEQYRPGVVTDATSDSRFLARDDLLYALRSVDKYAPWVRNIYILTNCAPPEWLNLNDQRITWVDHSEVFEASELPTFSSHSIEAAIHKIPGLSEHFIYSNDDFFLSKPTGKQDFFHTNGIAKTRLEGYGMVNGQPIEGQPDYLNSARNGARILFEEFGVYPTRLHTHSPHSLRKSVLEEMETKFPEDFERTRNNKFRAIDDIGATGFFHAHYAFLTGKAVPVGTPTRLIQQNHNYKRIFRNILNELSSGGYPRYLSICVNDGNESHLNDDWNIARDEFLQKMFPQKSRFEV